MADAAIIEAGGGESSSPLDWLKAHPLLAAVGVGGLAALVVLIRRQGAPSDTANGSALAPSGGQLSPSANIAIGQVAYDVTQGFGQAGIAARDQAVTTQSNFDRISAILAGLGTSVSGVSGQVARVTSQINDVSSAVGTGTNQQTAFFQALDAIIESGFNEQRAETLAAADPAHAQSYRDAFNRWLATIVPGGPGGSGSASTAVSSPNSLAASATLPVVPAA